MSVQKTYTIVLLGDTRAGKSSLANTIFGEDVFKVDNIECQAKSKSVHGRRITLINTPDFSGPGRSEEEQKPEILRCITEFSPGPHAFLIVLNVEKSTEQQQQAVIEKINQYLSEEAFKNAAVVFTQDDQVSEGMKTEKFIDKNKFLSDLVKKCKSRFHTINKYSQQGDNINHQSQIKALLNTIDQIHTENKGLWYISKMLPQGDTCSKLNNRVTKNGLIKLTGRAVELVANAFFGPAPETTNGAEEGSTVTDKEEGENKVQKEMTEKTKVAEEHESQSEPEKEEEREEAAPDINKGQLQNENKKTLKPSKQGVTDEFGIMLAGLFGILLGLAGTVLEDQVTFTIGVIEIGLVIWLMQKTNKRAEWVMQKINKRAEWVMQKINKWLMQKLNSVEEWAVQKLSKVEEWIMPKIKKWLMQKLNKIEEWVMQKLNRVADLAVQKLGNAAELVLPKIIEVAELVIPKIVEVAESVMPKINKVAELVMLKIIEVAELVIPKIIEVTELVMPKIIEIAELVIPKIIEVAELVMPKIKKVVEWITPKMNKVAEWVGGLGRNSFTGWSNNQTRTENSS